MIKNISLGLDTKTVITTNNEITHQLMVCSHERSGTHFLMNTMNMTSLYCSDPWLNYDLMPLGASLNFFSKPDVKKFLTTLSKIQVDKKLTCNASIIKSHFPISHLGDYASELPLKIIYIWRDPAETLTSLWKFFHATKWDEGPKVETPLELAAAKPSGQSQRYQRSNYRDYFERWAAHVIDGIENCKKNPKAICISYNQLLFKHEETTNEICNKLDIKVLKKPRMPSKDNRVIKGEHFNLKPEDTAKLYEFCNRKLAEHGELNKLFQKRR